jgi:hypothetical protein
VFSDFSLDRISPEAYELGAQVRIRLDPVAASLLSLLTFNKKMQRLHAAPAGSTGGFESLGPVGASRSPNLVC